jgi:putative phosphoribosyl transferase
MFDGRSHAGRVLGRAAANRVHESPLVVLALPRGGVPVGYEVARRLGDVEFDVFLVRKLGVPDHEELAFGAISTGGIRVVNRAIVEEMGLSDAAIERVVEREHAELERRERVYRQGRPPVAIRDRVAVLVDDGLATGATMIAAVRAVRLHQPKRVVVAVPVASRQAAADVRSVADEMICLRTPEPFFAVGYWYRDFDQVSDGEVRERLTTVHASTLHSALRTDD